MNFWCWSFLEVGDSRCCCYSCNITAQHCYWKPFQLLTSSYLVRIQVLEIISPSFCQQESLAFFSYPFMLCQYETNLSSLYVYIKYWEYMLCKRVKLFTSTLYTWWISLNLNIQQRISNTKSETTAYRKNRNGNQHTKKKTTSKGVDNAVVKYHLQ